MFELSTDNSDWRMDSTQGMVFSNLCSALVL